MTNAIDAVHRAEITAAVTRGAVRCLGDLGLAAITEFVLPDGLRADVAALGPDGALWVVEVKSGLEDFRADTKWPGYAAWCDCFAFAVDAAFPTDILPGDAGLIIADGFGGAVVRPPPRQPLAAARRKSLLIRFGRAAAMAALG